MEAMDTTSYKGGPGTEATPVVGAIATNATITTNNTNDSNNSNHNQYDLMNNKPGMMSTDEVRLELDYLLKQSSELAECVKHHNRSQEEFVIQYQHRQRIQHNLQIAQRTQDVDSLNKCVRDANQFDVGLRTKAHELSQMRSAFIQQQQESYNALDRVQQHILYSLLADWQRRQQLSGNGGNFDNNLDQIQTCCETLMECLWNNRTSLKSMDYFIRSSQLHFCTDELVLLIVSYTQNIKSLLAETFVLEKQPPQVMKTNTRFTATVRSLCGNKLNVQIQSPQVHVKIISEHHAYLFQQGYKHNQAYRHYPTVQQAITHQLTDPLSGPISPMCSTSLMGPSGVGQRGQLNLSAAHQPQHSMDDSTIQHQSQIAHDVNFHTIETSGEILNSSGLLEYYPNDRQLVCNFRNMQLKKIKRAEKKGTESVMDEKFTLLFHTTYKIVEFTDEYSSQGLTSRSGNHDIGSNILVFDIWTMSLPVVVIVHGNQEPHAWATITWDNAFALPGRLPFQVPELVYWYQLGQVLSAKFESSIGRGLSEDNLRFLASKVLRSDVDYRDDSYKDKSISWSSFAKDPLPERNFTFWEWFHSIIKLTREHLRLMWNDNRIIGFASRKETEEMLLNAHLRTNAQGSGTFLFRFSESELGGITVAWCHENPTNSQRTVLMLQPFLHKDLVVRTLADRMRDLKELLYLYPDTPKDVAFGGYYTPPSDLKQPNNNYLQPVLVQKIVNYPNTDCPPTPSSYAPSTPEDIYQDNSTSFSQSIESKYRNETQQPEEPQSEVSEYLPTLDVDEYMNLPDMAENMNYLM